jgi:hypothetical protein
MLTLQVVILFGFRMADVDEAHPFEWKAAMVNRLSSGSLLWRTSHWCRQP